MIEFKVENKIITIFNEELIIDNNIPIVINNAFKGNGMDLWDECVKFGCNNFILVNVSNIKWDDEMTPWKCKALFKGDSECKGKADEYLLELIDNIIPSIEKKLNYMSRNYILAGYSLGGLFAIYTMYKTDIFKGIISGSGSFWYPNFLEYIKSNKLINKAEKVYISLGDKEKESKIKIFSTVEDKTIELVEFFRNQNINIKFEFNEGNHYKDNYKRLAKGIKWIIN